MNREVRPHEKIRFKRSEITSLDDLPSAVASAPMRLRARGIRRVVKVCLGAVAAAVCVIGIALVVLVSDIGDERLRVEAQDIVAAMAGERFEPTIGGTEISFSGLQTLGLEVNDVRLLSAETREEAVRIGSAHFGVSYAPLARGEVQVGRIAVEDARIVLDHLPRDENSISFDSLFNSEGQLNPDAVVATVFAAADQFITLLGARAVDRVDVENVEVVLPSTGPLSSLQITQARLNARESGIAHLEASLKVGGRAGQLEAELDRDPKTGLFRAVTLSVDLLEGEEPSLEEAAAPRDKIEGLSLAVTGSQTSGPQKLSLEARVSGADFGFGKRGDRIAGDVALRATLQDGAGKIEIDALEITSGRSNWRLHGAIGPAPEADRGYRFELVSDGSTIAPDDVNEPAMAAVALITGHIETEFGGFHADEIRIRTEQGEATASFSLLVEPNLVPGFALRVDTTGIPVAQAKQLWPWFAAHGARDWVTTNIYGGRVESGFLEIKMAPGRVGDGVPLQREEMSGEFVVRGTRFDIAGRMPPMRDGNGSVKFDGEDVTISLDSGTVFMPGGRTVDASAGVLKIEDIRKRPLIGKVDVHVAGAADAVLQLATYDPINVSRYIDVAPDELTGKVSGKVLADIPLQRDIPIDTLEWQVDLKYDGLALAREFEGQKVSAANGTIVVNPRTAVIDTKAQLNGVPATLRLVEPLGPEKTGRERQVALQLDDAARQKFAPGLDNLISGSINVELHEGQGKSRAIKASLQNATLDIPWIGWTKGSGVPASVSFRMATDGKRIDLSDFKLSGETFGATGTLSLVDGNVSRIRFPAARLNRGDDFSLDMAAKGRGHTATVRGKSIDVRSLIKLVSNDKPGSGGGDAPTPISVDLAVDALVGFHGEILRNVKLTYSGRGARTDRLDFSAVTSSGQKVTAQDIRDGDVRNVSIQSADAGALLRFLDIYENVQGGVIALGLRGTGNGPLTGQVDTRDFWVVNEPRLRSLVSTPPPGDGRSLNQAVRGDLDTSKVFFERAFSYVEKGEGSLNLQRGVLRGPAIGSTFQGTLYDKAGNMELTGTFMPAYGLNRLFGEIPLIGQILGNGRDRGLIGITFKLAGKTDNPELQINPLSVIAPGIFRSVFEFR